MIIGFFGVSLNYLFDYANLLWYMLVGQARGSQDGVYGVSCS
jgi:hypothetical protein